MRLATSMLLIRRYETSISPLGWLHKCISQRNHSYPFHSSLCILNYKHCCISLAFFYTFTASDRGKARCKCLFALKEYKTWAWEWLFKDNILCIALALTLEHIWFCIILPSILVVVQSLEIFKIPFLHW